MLLGGESPVGGRGREKLFSWVCVSRYRVISYSHTACSPPPAPQALTFSFLGEEEGNTWLMSLERETRVLVTQALPPSFGSAGLQINWMLVCPLLRGPLEGSCSCTCGIHWRSIRTPVPGVGSLIQGGGVLADYFVWLFNISVLISFTELRRQHLPPLYLYFLSSF